MARDWLARTDRQHLAALMANISYEVMPFKRTEEELVTYVPRDIPITVTVTEGKGLDVTLDLSERLARHGYSVNPHIPARQVRGRDELAEVVSRLDEAGIDRIFVVGGDADPPAGDFHDAVSLLRALDDLGRPIRDIGVTGYPEGHASIPDSNLDEALLAKAPYASRVVTQICFDAEVIGRWAEDIARRGVDASVVVGLPGPVSRQKLVRISAGIGLGQSARFLQKQQGLLLRFFQPGGFNPNKLLAGLSKVVPRTQGNIRGLRVFTFNEIAGTEAWRRDLVASLPPAVRDL